MKSFWIAVLASVFGGIILWALFSDFLPSVVTTVWLLAQGVWGWSWGILFGTYSIPVWAILLVVILTLAAVLCGRHVLKRNNQPTAIRPVHTTFLSYTEDTIDGVKWRWRWIGSPASIENLCCFCQECDSNLLPTPSSWGGSTMLICERCPTQSNDWLTQEDVVNLSLPVGRGHVIATRKGLQRNLWQATEREIHRKVRTGEWQSANKTV